MDFIKKAWVTPWTDGLSSLTIESKDTRDFKLVLTEMTFPKNPTPMYPLRHTINIGLLSTEDLITLHKTIQNYLEN
jgi:hypothetical protein